MDFGEGKAEGKTELSEVMDEGGLEGDEGSGYWRGSGKYARGTFVFQHPPLTEAVTGEESSS